MRVSKLFIIAWVFSTLINASLPPTTLSGQSSATKPTTFTFKAPYSQATQISGIESLIETGDENMLVDPGMESSGVSAYTCTVGTCTKTTVSGEFSSGKQALKVALSSQAMNVSQTVNTPLGIQKQGYVRVLYRVPATMADFQICSIVNSAEQTCVPTNNLIKDDTFRSIEIPLIFNATNAGIKFKTTLSYSGNAFFDAAVVAQGLGTQNLMLDNTYSAQMSSGGVISGENKDWINGNCTGTAPYNCTLVSNVFSSTPNCTITSAEAGVASSARVGTINTSLTTSSQLSFTLHQSGVGNVASAAVITCQKSGNDYLAASSNVYSQSNSGTVSAKFVSATGTIGTSDTTLIFPTKLFDTTNSYNTSTGEYTVPQAGKYLVSSYMRGASFAATVNVGAFLSVYVNGTLKSQIGSAPVAGSATFRVDVGGSSVFDFVKGDIVLIKARYGVSTAIDQTSPEVNWGSITRIDTNSLIIGSFAGVPTVPGYQGNVDTFSVSFGATNLTTICSVSPGTPCFIDQIGSAVASITRSSVGAYVLNTTKTYIKLKCMSSVSTNTTVNLLQATMSCASCSSLPFSYVQPTVAYIDSLGTLLCQGSY